VSVLKEGFNGWRTVLEAFAESTDELVREHGA
jgi:hypothetical protein